MIKPTGEAWRNWKKDVKRKLERAGKPYPTDWEEYWESLHTAQPQLEDASMKERIRVLNIELEQAKKKALTHDAIRHEIIGVARKKPVIPDWLMHHGESVHSPGVPMLFLSDWHWGEVVDPKQIDGCNEYNLKIAHDRAKRCIENTIDLLTNHMVNPRYPGIVMLLGGDMFSGDIHEELSRTNEVPMIPSLLDLYGVLIKCIQELATKFGKVFVPCVTGNHSRTTKKPQSKGRNALNFDYLLYCLLEKFFENDKRVRFLVPDGSDATFNVYGVRYCLTHGDQFRGGDGMIGALGPIIRGDHRKRGRNAQLDNGYDCLLLGHWHQLIQMQRLIVNGCFPAGSNVLTGNGVKSIEAIEVGDAVMSRDGSIQTVTSTFTKHADRLVGIKVYGLPDVVWSTPNHLIWATKGSSKASSVTTSRREFISETHGPSQWIPMDFISPHDFVHVPFPKGVYRPIDTESAWAYGLYLAEGSTLLDGGSSQKHNRISLTMHEREMHILERFASWFDKTYGTTSKVYLRTRKNGCRTSEFVVSPGRDVCVWFRKTFGHGASGKHLPDGALWWHDELKAAIVTGWIDGDGHSAQCSDCRPTVSATTTSKDLAWGMFHLAPSLGVWPTLSRVGKCNSRKSDSYTVHMNTGQNVVVIDGEAFYRVAERYEKKCDIDVYDLEVSGEHTYSVGGVGVHNSLKGYDEYAYGGNFGFEEPKQALWITHPERGITFQVPVLVGEKKNRVERPWVTF